MDWAERELVLVAGWRRISSSKAVLRHESNDQSTTLGASNKQGLGSIDKWPVCSSMAKRKCRRRVEEASLDKVFFPLKKRSCTPAFDVRGV